MMSVASSRRFTEADVVEDTVPPPVVSVQHVCLGEGLGGGGRGESSRHNTIATF